MKFLVFVILAIAGMSRPARGAWVEILMVFGAVVLRMVAPRKGRVG